MSPHETIAHYRITAKLGEGGMGEVWRARDTKLNRDVAIKILPDAFANDPGRMARFEREAQVLAALNHPDIAAIYGIEEGALVMELVEGQTLAERIARGPIPLDETLALARQIADGLEAAHEKSIIHRDLKPANIKITPQGKVKILDFGLAKAFEPESAASVNLTNSPTLTLEATRTGMILGTAGYMTPSMRLQDNLLFVRDQTLMAQPFDAGTLEISGDPFPVAEPVAMNSTIGRGGFSISENGVQAINHSISSPGMTVPEECSALPASQA